MKSLVIKRSVMINRHKTSVSLEDPFWSGLKEIARSERATVSKLVAKIDSKRERGNLSSAIRLFVLDQVRTNGMLRITAATLMCAVVLTASFPTTLGIIRRNPRRSSHRLAHLEQLVLVLPLALLALSLF
jgi:predicted DNA-binding ribbon-helix-helix protein